MRNSALLVRNWAQRRHFFPFKGPGSEIDLLPPPPPPLILKKWRILRAVTTGPLLYFFSPGGGGGREVIGTILGANYWNIGIMVYWFLIPTNSLSRLKLIKGNYFCKINLIFLLHTNRYNSTLCDTAKSFKDQLLKPLPFWVHTYCLLIIIVRHRPEQNRVTWETPSSEAIPHRWKTIMQY